MERDRVLERVTVVADETDLAPFTGEIHVSIDSCMSMAGTCGATSIKDRLPQGHVVRVMILEHEIILGFLDELHRSTGEVEWNASSIRALAQKLLDAEPHHAREEQVLFPALEAVGISGPPSMMRREHEILRSCKHELLEAASQRAPDPPQVREIARSLIQMLRDHIHKENNILYPMAVSALNDPAIWERMKERCETIGPCTWGRDLH